MQGRVAQSMKICHLWTSLYFPPGFIGQVRNLVNLNPQIIVTEELGPPVSKGKCSAISQHTCDPSIRDLSEQTRTGYLFLFVLPLTVLNLFEVQTH